MIGFETCFTDRAVRTHFQFYMGCRENKESRLSCFDVGNWKNSSDLGIEKLERRNVLGRGVKIIFLGTSDI